MYGAARTYNPLVQLILYHPYSEWVLRMLDWHVAKRELYTQKDVLSQEIIFHNNHFLHYHWELGVEMEYQQ